MTKDEALRMALEALKQIDEAMPFPVAKLAIKKAEEALAQQSNISELKEKTANHNVDCLCADCSMLDDLEDATAQPEKDIPKIGCVNHDCDKCKAQPEQEPVAFVKGCNRGQWEIFPAKAYQIFEREQPLYTTPPQRTWVGLTPKERDEINEQVYGAVPHHVAFHAAIEAKLKEKNT